MRHLVDPALLAGLEFVPAFAFTYESLPAIRAGLDEMSAMMPEPQGTGVSWHDDTVTAPGGHRIAVRVYRPASPAGALPLILQIHGGGYVMGTHRMSHAANMLTAAAVEAV